MALPEAFTPNVVSPCCLPSLLLLPLLEPLLTPEQSTADDSLVAPLGRETEVLHGEVAVRRRDLGRASVKGDFFHSSHKQQTILGLS